MLIGGANSGGLELRAARDGSRRLSGRFPYGSLAVLSDGGKNGRPRKEQFAPKAFAYRINKANEDIHILVGHDYDRPLASRRAGTLELNDTDEALTFEALIKPEMLDTPYVQNFFGAFAAGLIGGISPGFRIPPERTVPNAEQVSEEDPKLGTALIRTVFAALLYELSLVVVPAYKDTEVEARTWSPGLSKLDSGLHRTLNRWRV
jgi:uncharacterized protein